MLLYKIRIDVGECNIVEYIEASNVVEAIDDSQKHWTDSEGYGCIVLSIKCLGELRHCEV